MENPTPGISLNDIRRVAELANLGLTDEEELRMQLDLSVILEYVAQLAEVDTTAIEPMTQVELLLPDRSVLTSREALRPDVVQPSLDRSVVMAEAPETDGRYFKVPKVIER
jgi:aspartyl-tRNA(Asn)/glutamyl-tRNA(Gln) amidotransferase subunit C